MTRYKLHIIAALLGAASFFSPFTTKAYSLGGMIIGGSHEVARVWGDLSQNKYATLNGLLLSYSDTDTYAAHRSIVPILRFSALKGRLTHGADKFPFPQKESLGTVIFLLDVGACYFQPMTVRYCAHIGQGTVNINHNDSRRDYGTWTYALMAEQNIGPDWSLQFFLRYIGRVEQRLSSVDSEFSMGTYGVAMSFGF